MTGWHTGTLYGFDVESTGVDVFNDRIVTATVCRVDPDGTIETREWLINPGIEIPETATAIHGITTDHAREHGRRPVEALAEIQHFVIGVLQARPLVAFNASYDLTILNAELGRHALERIKPSDPMLHRVVDPFVLDRGIDKWRKGKRTLPAMCAHYGVEFEETHQATADAVGAVQLARAIATKYPHLGGQAPQQLYQVQQQMHREKQESFAEYLRKQGKDASDVSAEWPLRANPARVFA